MIKKIICFILLSIYSSNSIADNLVMFKNNAQMADSAFRNGNENLCFQIDEKLILLFDEHPHKYAKLNEICKIVFEAYISLAVLDKKKTISEKCDLLKNGLSLIDKNPDWIRNYPNKNSIVNYYVMLTSFYEDQGDTTNANIFNKKMVTFAETYYKSEISSVLLNACSMNSRMYAFEKNYPLYKRLYEMYDDLDRLQQYEVVIELIHFEYQKKNYSYVVDLSLKHEDLIANSKNENKHVTLDLCGFSFLNNARMIANENGSVFRKIADDAYEKGCQWALRSHPLMYPTICVDYSFWLFKFDEQKYRAIKQIKLFLDNIESANHEKMFDGKYREVEDAEQALISIMVQEILKSSNPIDINTLLGKYPKVISSIMNSPYSKYYEDYVKCVDISKDICYGHKKD